MPSFWYIIDFGADNDRGAVRLRSFVILANFYAMADLSALRHALHIRNELTKFLENLQKKGGIFQETVLLKFS